MNLVIIGIIFIALGTFLTYKGQEINSKKDIKMLSTQNDHLQQSNQQLQKDITDIKTINITLQERIKELNGILTPDNKPTPSHLSSIPDDALILFIGNSFAYTNTFPHTVIEVGNEQLLVINKEENRITISAKFYSRDGKIVAELKDNKFYINPNNYFYIERPNEHILVVYDQQANQILNVEYMNPLVIKLLGIFYLPNRSPIVITDELQTFGGQKMSGWSFGNNGVDIHL